MNASFAGDRVKQFSHVHIGVAVAIDDGLITPVIRDADTKSLLDIAAESKALAERARNRRLQPNEYTGATFSISNLGMMGIDEFSAIINPPEAAILAVGAVREVPVVEGGQVKIGRRMKLTLSVDHRVADGAQAARFLGTLRRMLENPLLLGRLAQGSERCADRRHPGRTASSAALVHDRHRRFSAEAVQADWLTRPRPVPAALRA